MWIYFKNVYIVFLKMDNMDLNIDHVDTICWLLILVYRVQWTLTTCPYSFYEMDGVGWI